MRLFFTFTRILTQTPKKKFTGETDGYFDSKYYEK